MLDRTELRHQIYDILKGKTKAKDNVFMCKITPWPETKLPGINITTPLQNGASNGARHIPFFNATITVQIDVVVSLMDNYDDEIDEICEQIEKLILCNPDLIRQYSGVSSYNTEINYSDKGEQPIIWASITINFELGNCFNPIIPDRLEEIQATVNDPDGTPQHKFNINFGDNHDNENQT